MRALYAAFLLASPTSIRSDDPVTRMSSRSSSHDPRRTPSKGRVKQLGTSHAPLGSQRGCSRSTTGSAWTFRPSPLNVGPLAERVDYDFRCAASDENRTRMRPESYREYLVRGVVGTGPDSAVGLIAEVRQGGTNAAGTGVSRLRPIRRSRPRAARADRDGENSGVWTPITSSPRSRHFASHARTKASVRSQLMQV
jgi:hypothetical protein